MTEKQIDINEIHTLELTILEDVLSFCNEQGITFYLGYGSALGALRHKGFIPWDEDVDILIPSNEFWHFIEQFQQKYCEKYTLRTCNDKHFREFFGRISYKGQDELCAYVDVFILIGLPSDKETRESFAKKVWKLNKLRDLRFSLIATRSSNIIKRAVKSILYILISCIPLASLNKRFKKYCSMYDYRSSSFVMMTCSKYGLRNIFPKEFYGKPVFVPFESLLLPVPERNTDYLTQIYGDYKAFPPESVRSEGLNHKARFVIN